MIHGKARNLSSGLSRQYALAVLFSFVACDMAPVKFFTVTAEQPEGGTIVLTKGEGINCGDDCSQAFVPGTEITLKAEAAPGWFFRRWEGECSEQRAQCKFILTRDAQVFAVFRRDGQTSELAVQVSSDAGGEGAVISNPEGINCPGTCFALFPAGRRVRLDANPSALSQFQRWEGACTSTTPSCFVRMNEDEYVSAIFEPREVTLTVEAPEDGRIVSSPPGIDCGGTCSATFIAGTAVQLTAVADTDALFQNWAGACSGTETSCDLVLNTSTTASAAFLGMRDVNIKFSGGGVGSVISEDGRINCEQNCTHRYRQGDEVTVSSTARFGSRLVGWKDICIGTGPCTFTVTDNTDVEMEVIYDDFDVSITKVGGGAGRIVSVPEGIDCGGTCTATISYLTRISLTAEPEPGTEFAGWAGGCQGISSVCLATITGPLNVTAYFVPQYILGVSTQGVGSGVIRSNPPGLDCDSTCEGFFSRDSMVELTAEAYRGSYFIGWSGACSGSGDCMITLDQSLNVDATFGLLDYPVFTSVGGTGVGTVTSTEASIDCPGDLTQPWAQRQGQCSATLPFGTRVTFRAESLPGSDFVGWKGANCGTALRCTVTIQGEQSVQAIFEPRYKLVQAGEFLRGSSSTEPGREFDEGPQLPLSVSHGLWFKETEVTVGEWMRLMGSAPNPSLAAICGTECPVQGVSWDDAVMYVNALSNLEGLRPCYWNDGNQWNFVGLHCSGYRLPTEAEWEMAARAGSATPFATGGIDNAGDVCVIESNLSLLGWYCGNTVNPRNVAGLNANAFGLYDLHGNVAEWTNDVYEANYYGTIITNLTDPPGPVSTSTTGQILRVVRGGAYTDYARDCRSASRLAVDSSTRTPSIGFRPVRSNFSLVPAGSFVMGSESTEAGHQSDEGPSHLVVNTRPYLIERTELTQAQWRAYSPSNPSPSFFSACGNDCPVETISYDAAISYLNDISNARGLVPCYVSTGGGWATQNCSGYRLPTEAEWERAARAGEAGTLSGGVTGGTGCSDDSAEALGWYCYNAANMTHEVGSKAPNAWGLYDVHGNVSEWVSDWYDNTYYGTLGTAVRDPGGPALGTERVIRGGSWSSTARELRFASRESSPPSLALLQVGLRKTQEYCPASGQTVLGNVNVPSARTNMSVTRVGGEVMVWGGLSDQNSSLNNGAIYNTRRSSWAPVPPTAFLPARHQHAAVWSGKEVVIWGGAQDSLALSPLGTGARYAPATQTWTPMSSSSSPSPRFAHAMVWTGSEVVVWGGYNGQFALDDGARYVPETDTWVQMSEGPLSRRSASAIVWTGEEVFIFGGRTGSGTCANTYALYNPVTDTWSASLSNSAGCGCASDAYLVDENIVVISDGAWCQYDLNTKQWSQLPARPSGRTVAGPARIAAGASTAELFVFGGSAQSTDSHLDAYSPKTKEWRSSSIFNTASASSGASAQWTGCGFWMWPSSGVGSSSNYFIP